MLKPRNTLVSVVEIRKAEEKVGSIILPRENSNEYQECEIVAVGPGMCDHADELPLTRDLAVGQRVLVKINAARRISQDHVALQPAGVKYKDDGGRNLILVDQVQIVAILADPDPDRKAVSSDDDNEVKPFNGGPKLVTA
jgi:co-chaperonin GroES (HSP10)